MKTCMTLDEVRGLLRERIGNRQQKDLAVELGVTPAYLNDVLQGRRTPGPAVLRALGLTAQRHYTKPATGKEPNAKTPV